MGDVSLTAESAASAPASLAAEPLLDPEPLDEPPVASDPLSGFEPPELSSDEHAVTATIAKMAKAAPVEVQRRTGDPFRSMIGVSTLIVEESAERTRHRLAHPTSTREFQLFGAEHTSQPRTA